MFSQLVKIISCATNMYTKVATVQSLLRCVLHWVFSFDGPVSLRAQKATQNPFCCSCL
jgi:hypothetical protein